MAFQFDKPLMWANVKSGGDSADKPIKINNYFTVTTNTNGVKALRRTTPSLVFSQPTVLNFSDVEIAMGLAFKFSGYSMITEVNFPALETIEDYGIHRAFANCTSLQSVSFPALTTIGSWGMYWAFNNCYSLQTISFPALTTIGISGMYSTFENCSSLQSVNFPALTTIESSGMLYAFKGCSSLQTVDFPALTTIGISGMYNAFSNCTNLSRIHVPWKLSGVYAPSIIFGGAPQGYSIVKYDL